MAISSQGVGQGQDQSQAKSSDSSRWLFAQQRLRESGIPPAHERLWAAPTVAAEADGHMEAALAECTRAEANIGSLLRGLSHLTAGATAAREANSTLFRELDTLRELLGQSNEHELTLRHRVQALEQALLATEREAMLSRALLIEQEDLFLAELLTDHEREVTDLRRRLADSSIQALRPRSSSLDDEAADAVAAREREYAELERDSSIEVVPISTLPPPPDFASSADMELAPISTMPPPPDFDADVAPPSRDFVHADDFDERQSSIVELAPASHAMRETERPPSSASASRPIGALMLRTISIGPGLPRESTRSDEAPPPDLAPASSRPSAYADTLADIFQGPPPPNPTGSDTLQGLSPVQGGARALKDDRADILDEPLALQLDGLPSFSVLPPLLSPSDELDDDDAAPEAPEAEAASPVSSELSPQSRRDSKPALKQKPDPSTRPLVGYSLGSDDVAEEVIDTSRISSSRPTER